MIIVYCFFFFWQSVGPKWIVPNSKPIFIRNQNVFSVCCLLSVSHCVSQLSSLSINSGRNGNETDGKLLPRTPIASSYNRKAFWREPHPLTGTTIRRYENQLETFGDHWQQCGPWEICRCVWPAFF